MYQATLGQRAAVLEQVVIEHLGRYVVEASIQKQLFDIEYNLFYWIGKEGNEVDGVKLLILVALDLGYSLHNASNASLAVRFICTIIVHRIFLAAEA